jgi:hypothetical protein
MWEDVGDPGYPSYPRELQRKCDTVVLQACF